MFDIENRKLYPYLGMKLKVKNHIRLQLRESLFFRRALATVETRNREEKR